MDNRSLLRIRSERILQATIDPLRAPKKLDIISPFEYTEALAQVSGSPHF